MTEDQKNNFRVNLLDLPHERFYVNISENYKNYILNHAKNKFESNSKIIRKIGSSEPSFYRWRKENEYPLSILVKLLRQLELNPNEIQKHAIKIRSGVYPPRGKSSACRGEYIYIQNFPSNCQKNWQEPLRMFLGMVVC